MPPIVHVIRHGEGEHNINNSHHIRDPLLTTNGKQQCLDLQQNCPFRGDIEAIFVSPLKRTIQTAAYAFGPELDDRQLPIILVPYAQEISHLTCDRGTDAALVKELAPRLVSEAAPHYDVAGLDMNLVDDAWNSKEGVYEASLKAVRSRAADLRRWLWNRSEREVALVTHGAFLHYLTEDWATYDKTRGTGYYNCEYRTFQFTDDSNNEEAHLFERGSTRQKTPRPPGLDSLVIYEE